MNSDDNAAEKLAAQIQNHLDEKSEQPRKSNPIATIAIIAPILITGGYILLQIAASITRAAAELAPIIGAPK